LPIELNGPQAERVRQAVADAKSHLENNLQGGIRSAAGQHAGRPQSLTAFADQLAQLEQAVGTNTTSSATASVPDTLAPILATVVARERRRFVTELDYHRGRAVDPDLLRNLDAKKGMLDELLKTPWYVATVPLRLPRLTDFVAAHRSSNPEPAPPPRAKDDKFGILLSASALLGDLSQMREHCEERSVPLVIAFVDVDGLKALNTKFGELWVDALVLPPLMRSVERAVFGHGYAYRHGGDEFVVLIPSADQEVALAILERLRQDLARATFENGEKLPTVSIGLCILQPDAPLTDREALHWAAMAKREAKKTRNAIAVTIAERDIGDPVVELVPP
jgi:diguanylate cyclase (GGDEF)-like protein